MHESAGSEYKHSEYIEIHIMSTGREVLQYLMSSAAEHGNPLFQVIEA